MRKVTNIIQDIQIFCNNILHFSFFSVPLHSKSMKIGIFDSGYGGLTILDSIRRRLPEYDYLYLGDNARTPYGTRSFDVIYAYTLQAVRYLIAHDCRLIIVACNTASAKALRTIQQHDIDPACVRVLGVIRPTAEEVIRLTDNGHIGILATPGTVSSNSYILELEHISSQQVQPHTALHISQQACPMWVPLIEAGEHKGAGADYFVEKYIRELLRQDADIDTLVLACTHYPLLGEKIEQVLCRYPRPIRVVAQGEIVANSLSDYLKRHTEIEQDCSRTGTCIYQTTDVAEKFEESASTFLNSAIKAEKIEFFS